MRRQPLNEPPEYRGLSKLLGLMGYPSADAGPIGIFFGFRKKWLA